MYGNITLHSKELEIIYKDALSISELKPDSAIFILTKCQQQAISLGDTALAINCLISISDLNGDKLNYSSAFDRSEEALLLAEEFKEPILLAKTYRSFGILNYLFNQKNEAEDYLRASCNYFKGAYQKGLINISELIPPYFDLVLYHSWFNEYDKALIYLDSCYQISDTINHSMIKRAYLDAEKGHLLSINREYDSAVDILIAAALIFEDIEYNPEKPDPDKGFLVLLYSYLGEAYRLYEKDDLSMFFFDKSLHAIDLYNKHIAHKAYILERISWLQLKQQNFEGAYASLAESNKINETYFSVRSFRNAELLNVRSHYRGQLVNKNKELSRKNRELAQKKNSLFWFQIILGAMGILIVFLTLISRPKTGKAKFKREAQNSTKNEEGLKALMEQKNKELTAFTLTLIEKEEIIAKLREHIIQQPNGQERDNLLASSGKSSTSLWDDFNRRFISANDGFYERLQEAVPVLSPGDLKICALIKLNFTGNEMSHLLGISLGSVHMARHRLRKKMNMDRDVKLSSFIESI